MVSVRFAVKTKNVELIRFYRSRYKDYPEKHYIFYIQVQGIFQAIPFFIVIFPDTSIEIKPIKPSLPYEVELRVIEYDGNLEKAPSNILALIQQPQSPGKNPVSRITSE